MMKDVLIREIELLPEEKQEQVLAFVRFLRIGLADVDRSRRDFWTAVDKARRIARERGITEQDIEDEIKAVRARRACEQ